MGQLSGLSVFSVPLTVYSLSIHGVYHLDVNLKLIQREQHPVSPVRTPSQINQIYLRRGGQLVIYLCWLHIITEMKMDNP